MKVTCSWAIFALGNTGLTNPCKEEGGKVARFGGSESTQQNPFTGSGKYRCEAVYLDFAWENWCPGEDLNLHYLSITST